MGIFGYIFAFFFKFTLTSLFKNSCKFVLSSRARAIFSGFAVLGLRHSCRYPLGLTLFSCPSRITPPEGPARASRLERKAPPTGLPYVRGLPAERSEARRELSLHVQSCAFALPPCASICQYPPVCPPKARQASFFPACVHTGFASVFLSHP